MPRRLCLGLPGGQPCPGRRLVQATPYAHAGARCADCQRARERARRARRPYVEAERREHAQLVAAWVAAHGYQCPGCLPSGWQPHPADPERNPLTVDHIQRVADGGRRVGGAKRVMCRAGNSARRD